MREEMNADPLRPTSKFITLLCVVAILEAPTVFGAPVISTVTNLEGTIRYYDMNATNSRSFYRAREL